MDETSALRGAVLGEYLRLGNIWETVELLKQIQNATKIFTFDSEKQKLKLYYGQDRIFNSFRRGN